MKDLFFPQTMAIRMPSFMTKLIAAEVAKRNFIKKNGQGNENEFFNKMLPNMLAYRAYKKGYLRKYLDKNIKESISEGMQEKILDFLAESFDYLYFDESEYACDDVVNLRFDVDHEELFAELFVRLDGIGVKRSSYLRNLIHEYLNQSEYQKERICFNEEYNKLSDAIETEKIIQFKNTEDVVVAFPVALEYSVKKEHWYVLYFTENKFDTLYATPLYGISKILLRRSNEIEPPANVSQKIYAIIENEEFADFECFEMIGDGHA